MLWIKIEMTDIYVHLIFKVKAIQKCQHCQLCALRENSNMLHIQDLDFVLESIYHLMACLVKLELKEIWRTEIECRHKPAKMVYSRKKTPTKNCSDVYLHTSYLAQELNAQYEITLMESIHGLTGELPFRCYVHSINVILIFIENRHLSRKAQHDVKENWEFSLGHFL